MILNSVQIQCFRYKIFEAFLQNQVWKLVCFKDFFLKSLYNFIRLDDFL